MTAATGCLGVGRMAVPPGWAAPAHAHPFTEILLLLAGELTVELPGTAVAAGPGDVLVYQPSARHRERVRGGRTAEFIFLAHDLPGPGLPPLVRDGEGRIRLLAAWLREERQGSGGDAACSDAFLAALLAELARAARPAPDPLLAGLRGWMREHLADPITVVDLARRAGMSRAHFIRTYRALAGLTPMADLRRMRVEAARELVIATGRPLRSIAAAVGFYDEYHLSRTFRRLLGMPPASYRC